MFSSPGILFVFVSFLSDKTSSHFRQWWHAMSCTAIFLHSHTHTSTPGLKAALCIFNNIHFQSTLKTLTRKRMCVNGAAGIVESKIWDKDDDMSSLAKTWHEMSCWGNSCCFYTSMYLKGGLGIKIKSWEVQVLISSSDKEASSSRQGLLLSCCWPLKRSSYSS